ncbi:hypothetical protein SmJEL517_g06174 [Synchytrium microbalum]|uniref:F-box domain-containing protein n=1 Tax=Synchytrium microbalum TaxID=1806994 RepID=A0A507BSU8_9FUNG|nr:uncharacterized protein SmJEL517_g06174 [Synchytrium microbalum]TPX30209.1 hypothetical protein SmJEL517_g06174 [Synchytrium microbalum]
MPKLLSSLVYDNGVLQNFPTTLRAQRLSKRERSIARQQAIAEEKERRKLLEILEAEIGARDALLPPLVPDISSGSSTAAQSDSSSDLSNVPDQQDSNAKRRRNDDSDDSEGSGGSSSSEGSPSRKKKRVVWKEELVEVRFMSLEEDSAHIVPQPELLPNAVTSPSASDASPPIVVVGQPQSPPNSSPPPVSPCESDASAPIMIVAQPESTPNASPPPVLPSVSDASPAIVAVEPFFQVAEVRPPKVAAFIALWDDDEPLEYIEYDRSSSSSSSSDEELVVPNVKPKPKSKPKASTTKSKSKPHRKHQIVDEESDDEEDDKVEQIRNSATLYDEIDWQESMPLDSERDHDKVNDVYLYEDDDMECGEEDAIGEVEEDEEQAAVVVRFPRSFELKITLRILEYLDNKTVLKAHRVSRFWNRSLNKFDKRMWMHRVMELDPGATVADRLSTWKKVYIWHQMITEGLCYTTFVSRISKDGFISPTSHLMIQSRPTRAMAKAQKLATSDSATKLSNDIKHFYMVVPSEDRRMFDSPSSFPLPKAFLTIDMRLGIVYRADGLWRPSNLQMTNLWSFASHSRKLGRLNGPVFDACFLPEASMLVTSPCATIDDDHECIKMYKMRDGILEEKYVIPAASASPCAKYPASVLAADEEAGLLVVTHDGWINIWSIDKTECKETIDVHRYVNPEEQIENVAIGGDYVVVVTRSSNFILVFDVVTGQHLHTFDQCCHALHARTGESKKWSEHCTSQLLIQGPLLFASQNHRDCRIQVFNLHTGHHFYTLKPYDKNLVINQYITSMYMSADRMTLAVGLSSSDIILYDFWPVKINRSVITAEKDVEVAAANNAGVFPFSVLYRELKEVEEGRLEEVEGVLLF